MNSIREDLLRQPHGEHELFQKHLARMSRLPISRNSNHDLTMFN